MNENARPQPVQVAPIHYQILCAASLLLLFISQFSQNAYYAAPLIACAGAIGILTRWRIAPLLLLLTLAGTQLFEAAAFGGLGQAPPRLLQVRDLLTAAGLIAYLACHYRLQSVERRILPMDPRQRQMTERRVGRQTRLEFASVGQKRSAHLLTPQEIARLVLTLPFWAILGQVLWVLIARDWWDRIFLDEVIFHERFFRLLNLAWILIGGAIVFGGILEQWRLRQMDPVAARVFLQDTLWRETRREQRRIFRWLAWRRLRERAEKEG